MPETFRENAMLHWIVIISSGGGACLNFEALNVIRFADRQKSCLSANHTGHLIAQNFMPGFQIHHSEPHSVILD